MFTLKQPNWPPLPKPPDYEDTSHHMSLMSLIERALVAEKKAETLTERVKVLEAERELFKRYYDGYMQDEANSPVCCLTDEQHELAVEIKSALTQRKP